MAEPRTRTVEVVIEADTSPLREALRREPRALTPTERAAADFEREMAKVQRIMSEPMPSAESIAARFAALDAGGTQ